MTIYILRIELLYTKPPIWRRLAVPSDITLGQLHEVIQIAMGWCNAHLHQFTLGNENRRPSPGQTDRMLESGEMLDFLANRMGGRRVFVPMSNEFGDLDMDGEDEDRFTLAKICPKVKGKLTYEYDFGDGWEHSIQVQKIIEPKAGVSYPICQAGKRGCPPEDCGGVGGYYRMLEIIADPNHEEYEDMIDWLGEDFDPEGFDMEEVNDILADWREED